VIIKNRFIIIYPAYRHRLDLLLVKSSFYSRVLWITAT